MDATQDFVTSPFLFQILAKLQTHLSLLIMHILVLLATHQIIFKHLALLMVIHMQMMFMELSQWPRSTIFLQDSMTPSLVRSS